MDFSNNEFLPKITPTENLTISTDNSQKFSTIEHDFSVIPNEQNEKSKKKKLQLSNILRFRKKKNQIIKTCSSSCILNTLRSIAHEHSLDKNHIYKKWERKLMNNHKCVDTIYELNNFTRNHNILKVRSIFNPKYREILNVLNNYLKTIKRVNNNKKV